MKENQIQNIIYENSHEHEVSILIAKKDELLLDKAQKNLNSAQKGKYF